MQLLNHKLKYIAFYLFIYFPSNTPRQGLSSSAVVVVSGPIPSQTASYKSGQANLNSDGTPRVRNIQVAVWEKEHVPVLLSYGIRMAFLVWEHNGYKYA